MRLLVMSDIHCQFGRFDPQSMPDPSEIDHVIVAGDITNLGKLLLRSLSNLDSDWLAARRWMQRLQNRYDRAPILWVPGNHDIGVWRRDLEGSMLCLENDECYSVSMDGYGFIGTSLCTAFDAPRLADQWAHTTADPAADMAHWDRVEQYTSEHKGNNLIVVSHCPPFGCLDEAAPAGSGRHIGSPGLTKFIHHKKPALVVCGHVHEAAGEAMIGETRVINTACRWQVVEL